jgi:hypothetical protein
MTALPWVKRDFTLNNTNGSTASTEFLSMQQAINNQREAHNNLPYISSIFFLQCSSSQKAQLSSTSEWVITFKRITLKNSKLSLCF